MDEPIVVGIDVGTTKICTLVARRSGGTFQAIQALRHDPGKRGLTHATGAGE